jgi:hypothetical protein
MPWLSVADANLCEIDANSNAPKNLVNHSVFTVLRET